MLVLFLRVKEVLLCVRSSSPSVAFTSKRLCRSCGVVTFFLLLNLQEMHFCRETYATSPITGTGTVMTSLLTRLGVTYDFAAVFHTQRHTKTVTPRGNVFMSRSRSQLHGAIAILLYSNTGHRNSEADIFKQNGDQADICIYYVTRNSHHHRLSPACIDQM